MTLTSQPAGGSTTFSGVIQTARATSLTLNGLGTQVLAGTNTYSGLTTITAGTLQLGNGGATGSIDNTSGRGGLGMRPSTARTTWPSPCPSPAPAACIRSAPACSACCRLDAYSGPTVISGGTLQTARLPSLADDPSRHEWHGLDQQRRHDRGFQPQRFHRHHDWRRGQLCLRTALLPAAGSMPTGGSFNCPRQPCLRPLTAWTDSIWVYVGSVLSGQLMGCRENTNLHGFVESYYPGTGRTAGVPGTAGGWLASVAADVTLSTAGWNMITLTAGPGGSFGSYQFYVNGLPVATTTGYGGNGGGDPIMVGLSDDPTDYPDNVSNLVVGPMSNASLADFQLYGSVLSAGADPPTRTPSTPERLLVPPATGLAQWHRRRASCDLAGTEARRRLALRR